MLSRVLGGREEPFRTSRWLIGRSVAGSGVSRSALTERAYLAAGAGFGDNCVGVDARTPFGSVLRGWDGTAASMELGRSAEASSIQGPPDLNDGFGFS